ncbi:T9SS type A sorting domain-containing protein [Soonwooa sp.]|uniref:T9SS type A sorting domain-containing protein n=1 Tax=Soonwooa sp. TaxID=1938592 RepID=UPI00260B9875|nr:T9SS type A sorting domain-containing protein [Soonwooa sp.]
MKKKKLLLSICGALLLTSSLANAQEYRKIIGPNTAFQDVNDNGVGVMLGYVYSWSTDKAVPKESSIYRLYSINNNGDMTGGITSTASNRVPAFKLNGSSTWTQIPFPENTTSSKTFTECVPYQISENGRYVVGSMGVFDQILQTNMVIPFIYDTTTGVVTRPMNSDFKDGTLYGVNDSGNVGGWVDIPIQGNATTRRVATLYSNSGVFQYIKNNKGELPKVITNEVKGINKNGVAVGQFDNLPFIYDPASDTYTEFANPDPATYFGGAFSSISDDGTVVGMWYNGGQKNRFAIIYNPSLGTTPKDLKTFLEDKGVAVNSSGSLGNMGPAIAISPNGKYVAGFEDGPAVQAYGWIVSMPEKYLANNDTKVNITNINVYPNPVIDELTVDLKSSKSGIAKVELYSMEGKLLLAENKNMTNGANNFKMNVAQVAKGTKNLILVINTPEGNRITKKLVMK